MCQTRKSSYSDEQRNSFSFFLKWNHLRCQRMLSKTLKNPSDAPMTSIQRIIIAAEASSSSYLDSTPSYRLSSYLSVCKNVHLLDRKWHGTEVPLMLPKLFIKLHFATTLLFHIYGSPTQANLNFCTLL